MIIDGKFAILGRVASKSAKALLKGDEVTIINAEKIIITGNPLITKKKYLARRDRGNPFHGPFFPRKPEDIVQRTIRGMLPYKKPRGKIAFKKLRVCVNSPIELKEKPVEMKHVVKSNYITLGDLAKTIG